jgi:myo-inositol-1(or 4)-monophosphatase
VTAQWAWSIMGADAADDAVSRWHPFHDEPRAAAAARLAVLGGQMALDRIERGAGGGKGDSPRLAGAPPGFDGAIQSRMIDEIRRSFPGDGILCEDGRAAVLPNAEPAHWWVLDPVDGATNLRQSLPGFAVSIGVLRDGMPLAGAVYDPLVDWLFTAASGRGAWLNGRGLRVVPTPLSAETLFSIRPPYEGEIPPFVPGWLSRYRLRRFGSTALQLCYVAVGGLAFIHDQAASLSELAGAVPVLLEAGGVISGVDGSALFPFDAGVAGGDIVAFLAGNPIAHRESLAEILAVTDHAVRR